jgi:hypothetical protein
VLARNKSDASVFPLQTRGPELPKADAYRGYAADCLRLAQSVSESVDKVLLLEMAARWLRLADFAETREKHSTGELT